MAEQTTPLVGADLGGPVATITLDSPHNRNALSRRLVDELTTGLELAEAAPGVRVVLLRAAGPTFCSGADLAEAAAADEQRGPAGMVALMRRIVSLDKPVVARVHGAVRAGGIGVVAACDVVVSADDATFALTEVRLALAPAVISMTVLARMHSRAASLAFLGGEVFDGATAAEAGLVTRAVPDSHLDAEVTRVCSALAAGHPQGLRETKRLLARDVLARIDADGPEMTALSARLFGSEDAREAMRGFLDRGR